MIASKASATENMRAQMSMSSPRQTKRITRAVPLLVMLRHHARRTFQKLDAAQNLLTVHRMFAHQYPFFRSQLRRLAQDQIRHANLSNVMKQRSKLKRLHALAVQTILSSQTQTVADHSLRMSVRFQVSGFERGGQRFQCRSISIFQ